MHSMKYFLTLITLAAAAPGEPVKDACKCLKWKDLYDPVPPRPEAIFYPIEGDWPWPRLMCGESNELVEHVHMDHKVNMHSLYYLPFVIPDIYKAYCENFFHKMDNNYCVSTGHMHESPDSWCIVDKACVGEDLNGGVRLGHRYSFWFGPKSTIFGKSDWWLKHEDIRKWVNRLFHAYHLEEPDIRRDVGFKICDPGQDQQLGDLEPPALLQLGASMGTNSGLVAKMAYAQLVNSGAHPQGLEWTHIEEHVLKGEIESLPKSVQNAIAENRPIVVDVQPDGLGDQFIIHGKKIYHLEHKCAQTPEGQVDLHCTSWPLTQKKDMGQGEL